MWRELIQRHTPSYTFFEPAAHAELVGLEETLGVKLPADLSQLLLESNGVDGEYGLGLVWPVQRICEDNLEFRNAPLFKDLYMPFDCLLFFADAGNGDQFAYAILDAEIRRTDIYAWNHENDSRSWVASSLRQYLEWWLSGRIKL